MDPHESATVIIIYNKVKDWESRFEKNSMVSRVCPFGYIYFNGTYLRIGDGNANRRRRRENRTLSIKVKAGR